MSAGPKLVGTGRFNVRGELIGLDSGQCARSPRQSIEIIEPLYTLPPDLRRAWVPSLRQKLIWGLMGAALMGLACLAAYVAGWAS